jgi:ABC-type sulfate transport system substrate-binding protein
MSVYKVNQTGANTHPGGLKTGLLRLKYQSDSELLVANEPINPAAWHRRIHNSSFPVFKTDAFN